jgi:hypothetical protein
MMGCDDVNGLLGNIATAADEAHIIALTANSRDVIAALPEREREQINERIADAVREWREVANAAPFHHKHVDLRIVCKFEHAARSRLDRPQPENRQLVLPPR